ncbi:MAG TPA: hypothetical protein VGO43_04095 [Pyrinomonadaceae bacterium]|jgi:hypothetical protein|nr:hypothetical protein [Pyrinomonadaceae bacterium]
MEVAFCQTISFNADTFEYESVSQENGNATIIKFPVDEKLYSPGDVVVVMSGEDISFHGIIGKIEDGYAFASDPRGSLLAATTIQ